MYHVYILLENTQLDVHPVEQGWICGTETELGVWQRAKGFGWLASDYSGCWVFTEGEGWWDGGGGTETAAFTLHCKPHTHAHTPTSTYTEGCSYIGNPTSPAVSMCVFVLQLARWDQWFRVTAIYTSGPGCSWTRFRLGGREAGGCKLTKPAVNVFFLQPSSGCIFSSICCWLLLISQKIFVDEPVFVTQKF